MRNAQSNVRHRPTPRKRCQEDGLDTVKEIVARNIPSIVVTIVGCLCVALPIAYNVAGEAYWPFVVAYGGCLVGCALGGVIR